MNRYTNHTDTLTASGTTTTHAKGVRVVVGLSGGVDSSVAAYLLKEQGYDVVGIFMKNWHDDSVTISKECPWLDDSNDAMIVAQHLGIPFQAIDLSEPYKERIVDYMFDEYQRGRTPNPDILCNREIKFDIFLNTALNLPSLTARRCTGCWQEKTATRIKAISFASLHRNNCRVLSSRSANSASRRCAKLLRASD
jgi:asparagine synthetase B (glutamine-hydrolysing)